MASPRYWPFSRSLEFHHEAGTHDDFARAKIREPVTHAAITSSRIGAAAHAACGRPVVAAGRRYAARSRPIGNARMPERRFRPPGNPVVRHVLEIDLRIPLIEFLSRLLCEVRRAAGGRRSIDGWGQGQIAAGVVHESAANRYRVQIVMEPGTIVEHHPEKFLLVRSLRAVDAAAVLAAEIPRQTERHFG